MRGSKTEQKAHETIKVKLTNSNSHTKIHELDIETDYKQGKQKRTTINEN